MELNDASADLCTHNALALSQEIEGAICAIAEDDMQRFADSIDRQELLVSLLSASMPFREHRHIHADMPAQPAMATLHAVGSQYAALIRQVTKTNALLMLLQRGHAGEMREIRDAGQRGLTWSCEA